MSRGIYRRVVLLAALVACACDEPFSPKSAFQEQYVLQCFVEGSYLATLARITVVLGKTYDVDGFDPSVNTTDPSIGGAEVTLSVEGKRYLLLESFRSGGDTVRYGANQRIYSALLLPPKLDARVSIEAKLPNGRTISAQTTIPRGRAFGSSYIFANGLNPRIAPQPGKPDWTVDWEDYDDTEIHLFFPRLSIVYTKMEEGTEIAGSVSVPMFYATSGGSEIPVYPSNSTRKLCSFEFAAIDSAMAQISAGDPNKFQYGVHAAILEVIEYDVPLTKYYSSVNGALDQFSIRTDERTFSNIGGGIGIFGSFVIHKVQFDFDPRYVLLYGYRYR